MLCQGWLVKALPEELRKKPSVLLKGKQNLTSWRKAGRGGLQGEGGKRSGTKGKEDCVLGQCGRSASVESSQGWSDQVKTEEAGFSSHVLASSRGLRWKELLLCQQLLLCFLDSPSPRYIFQVHFNIRFLSAVAQCSFSKQSILSVCLDFLACFGKELDQPLPQISNRQINERKAFLQTWGAQRICLQLEGRKGFPIS